MKNTTSNVISLFNHILDVIFPIKCISCGKHGKDFCLECISKSPSPSRESPNWIFSLFDYHHPPIKKSIWLLKYKGKKKISEVFANILYDKITEELSDLSKMNNFKDPVLIPIPLSKKRYRERGYNQSELICKSLIKIDELFKSNQFRFEKNVLFKNKETEHQANIKDRNIRLRNISGSFTIKNQEFIKNKNIILIDDVLTTGATLSEARKILKNNGAKKIIAFTIAH